MPTRIGAFYEPNSANKRWRTKNCDLYVVRLLPAGRKIQGTREVDHTLFGNSKPCLRCLQALQALGVRRVLYTTGGASDDAGEIEYATRLVRDMLVEELFDGGHSSKGDRLWREQHLS